MIKNTVLILIMILLSLSGNTSASAENWEEFARWHQDHAPSRSKRRTQSGRRLLREKTERIMQIDVQARTVLQNGDYARAEELYKEALGLTIETYGLEDIRVAKALQCWGSSTWRQVTPPRRKTSLHGLSA